ncbi:MAG: hypothetical protein QNI84_10520 [Henriciella sp.]|nr:hypothetical protein [Henriciella sp.]
MQKLILSGLCALGLVACATTPVYEAADNPNDFGYTEQRIEDDRYRVSYNGDSSTPRATVENFLLYRMSEITLNNGYDHFKVLETDTECHTEYRSTDTRPCSYHVRYDTRFPYRSYGFLCDPTRTFEESKRYESVAFITLHRGDKPDNDPYTFSASVVKENLESQIDRS